MVPDDIPATLGASFLDRFACRVRVDNREIRIARVAPLVPPSRDARSGERPFTTKPPS